MNGGLHEAIRGAARRSNAAPWPILVGEIVSYDPSTSFVVAQYDVTDRNGNTFQQHTPPSQLMMPWWGQNYGDQMGPEPGAQCVIAILDPVGNQFLVLGFTANDLDPGFGTPSSERQILDKRGSFAWWTAARGGALRLFGAAYATLFGANGTEVGAENLDVSEDAIITKRYLDEALTNQIAQLKEQLTTWASTNLQGGAGAPGPTTLTAITSTGSSLARAAQ